MNRPSLVYSWFSHFRDAEFGNCILNDMLIQIGGTFDHKINKGLLNSDSGNRMRFFLLDNRDQNAPKLTSKSKIRVLSMPRGLAPR